ncbi:MAG: hypothetical protein ACRDCW_06890 [Sarcina sp.]
MSTLDKVTPRVNKRTLILVAGLVWGFAGFRVFTLLEMKNQFTLIDLVVSIIVFAAFYFLIFSKMFKKHTKRILNDYRDKKCIFGFFDVKSYIIMGSMITLGILARSSGLFNPRYLGDFYSGLGVALFLAGVSFLITFIKFSEAKAKYIEKKVN